MRKTINFLGIAAAAFCFLGSLSFAQGIPQEQDGLGLTVEELITGQGKWKFELGTTFSTTSQDREIGALQTIQTGTGTFVTVPIGLGTSWLESSVLLTNLGLRYGLTAQTEIFTSISLSFGNSDETNGITGAVMNTSSSGFNSWSLGVNHRFSQDNQTAGLIGFADIALAENASATGTQIISGKSGTIGLTAYKVFDPVVLSITGGYRPSLERDVNGQNVDPGDSFFLSPSVAFAVNNEVTLSGGVNIQFIGSDKVNGISQGSNRTRGSLDFGIAYALDQKSSLNFSTRADVVGDGSLSVGINFTRGF